MRYLLLVTSLLFSHAVFAGEQIDKSIDADRAGEVEVDIMRGDVDVKTWDKSEVHVEGELDDATREFIFKRSGDKVLIKVEVDDGFFNKNWGSDDTNITIHIPEDSFFEGAGVSTDFDVNGVKGGVRISTVSGRIDLDTIHKEIDIETVSGDVIVTDSEGKMSLSTVSGDIEAFGTAVHFDAATVSGDVEADIGTSDIVDLSSVSGDLELEFTLAKDGRVDATTVSGDVKLKFENKVVNARFDIDTGPGGDIRNSITDDKPETSFIGSENVSFKTGNGDGSVELETMSGSIEVTK